MNLVVQVGVGAAEGRRFFSWRKRLMIHYSCDLCKRPIVPEDDLRYVVKIEVYAAIDPVDADPNDDRDHLQEMQDLLQRTADDDLDSLDDDVYQSLRFDLCPECRKKFLQNPLARQPKKQFDFSKN
jgi:hypothetical protein